MKPFQEYSLSQIINTQQQKACKKIDKMNNDEIMANDLGILAENIYQEFYIEPVKIYDEDIEKRSVKQGKIIKYIDPFFRTSEDQAYIQVDGIIATFHFPYTGDSTLFHCCASTFSFGPYPEISVSPTSIAFAYERSLDEMSLPNAQNELNNSLQHDLKDIKDGISYVNNDVDAFNNSLKKIALDLLQEKKKKIEAYYSIAKMLEVPIKKNEYAKQHIPLERRILPTAKKYESSKYYDITDTDYNDILSTIKHTGSTYERTPSSYKSLHEEDLRNTLLAALNATYKGDATGEAFRNNGKTDICIERENRAAFVAECKMWTGPKDVHNAINQLDGYLTWRDCKTALIYFVRNKDFISTLKAMESSLRSFDEMKSVTIKDKNEFDCLFPSKSNIGQQIHLRVILFNLYCK